MYGKMDPAVRFATTAIRAQASMWKRDPAWLADRLFGAVAERTDDESEVIRRACNDILNAEMEGDDRG